MSAEEREAEGRAKEAAAELRRLEKVWVGYIDEVSMNHPGFSDAQMKHEQVLWHERQGIVDETQFFPFPWDLADRPKPADPNPETVPG